MNNQIEEMAQIINGSTEIDTIAYYRCRNIAKTLYLQGYRKNDKDSVVLSREEQKKILTATEKRIKELKKQILQARKETAEKILTELLNFVNDWFEGVENNDFGIEFNRISKGIAEKYDVKIKE